MSFTLTSPDFENGGEIPSEFTCDGPDISPELRWSGVPAGTRALALIVDDPDAPDPAAPKMVWVHWVLYNIPPHVPGLGRAIRNLPPGTREGRNDWGETGWRGPCPPIGRHRYFFRLHALDTTLPDLGTPTKAELMAAMRGHVLETATLMGTYARQG